MLRDRGRHQRWIAVPLALVVLTGALPVDALARTACPVPLARQAPATKAVAKLRRELLATKRQLTAARARMRASDAEVARLGRQLRAVRQQLAAAQGRPVARARRAARRSGRIRLSFDDTAAFVSFARERGMRDASVVVRASRPLPRSIRPTDIKVEVLRDLRRVGDNLVSLPRVGTRFSKRRISQTRDRIVFAVCVNGDDLDAGAYAGTLQVSGPRPLGHVDVPVAVAVKDADFFYRGVILALIATFLFLLYKELRNDGKLTLAAWRETRPERPALDEPEGGWPRAWWVTRRAGRWTRERLGYVAAPQSHFGLDFFVLEVGVPIGAAFAAMYGIYASTATWGADGVAQWFSLLTTAFTAAGVRSLITTATPARPGRSGRARRRRRTRAAAVQMAPPRPAPGAATVAIARPVARPRAARARSPATRARAAARPRAARPRPRRG